MVCWATSGLSQKEAAWEAASSSFRRLSLGATSKAHQEALQALGGLREVGLKVFHDGRFLPVGHRPGAPRCVNVRARAIRAA